jgi:hypothetical protein
MGNMLMTGGYKNITATGNVSPVTTDLLGIFVSTSTSGTITIYDSATTTTSAPITGTFNVTAGTWYAIPASASAGLYIVVGGTLNATVIFG